MRDFIRRLTGGAVAGLGFLAILAMVPTAYAVTLQIFTGTTGAQPIQGTVPGVLPDLNTILNNVAAAVQVDFAATTNGNAGELHMTNSAAFAANGSVNTGLTAVGPVGSHTTVQKWLQVLDSAGTIYYIPCF